MRRLLRFIGHQKWIRFGVRDRLVRYFQNPEHSSPLQFRVNFFDFDYDGDLGTYIDWSVFYFGAYSEEELEFMKDCVEGKKYPVIIDIGANIGHHTLFASSIASKVHSFEPFREVSKKLVNKLRSNKVENVVLHDFALGNSNETLKYFPPTNSNTGTGTFVKSGEKPDVTGIPLEIKKGDEYFNSIGLKQINFIKLDVEGFEEQVLKGLEQTLNNTRPIVFFEWSAKSRQLNTEYKHLFPTGYEFFLFKASSPKFFIFQKFGYRLFRAERDNLEDGNRVAIPKEELARFSSRIYPAHV